MPNAAIPPAGLPAGNIAPAARNSIDSRGRPSQCEPFRELIVAKLGQQLSAQRIWQDLTTDPGFTGGSYDSVKRFVRRLGATTPLPFRRMECLPGEEAQVDFGTGAPIVGADGKRRKTYVFRIVLSHSRKAYSEATFTQTAEDFIRCLENAFAHFGGVPRTLVIDNLRAAVAHPDWFDPQLTPKVQSFCRHYGTTILPTKPYTPRHKGKVESGVKYVKNNALKARSFTSLEEQNRFLSDWERTVADTRIHGTTKRQVGKVFREVERAALLAAADGAIPVLPRSPAQGQSRRPRRSGQSLLLGTHRISRPRSVGPMGRPAGASIQSSLGADRRSRAARARPFQHARAHIAREKISGLEKGAEYLLNKVGAIGGRTQQWAEGDGNMPAASKARACCKGCSR